MIQPLRAVIVLPLVALAVALAASVEAAPRKGPKPDPCATARYLVVGGPIVMRGGAEIPALRAGASVALDGACNAVAATELGANRKGVTQLRAKWKNCNDLGGGNARLDARITDGCRRLRGTLRAKGLKRPRHFDGVLSQCGDGMPDEGNGEECDDGNAAPGDGCEPTCVVTPPPRTTTTQPPATTTTTNTAPTTTTTLPAAVLSLAAIAGPDPVQPGGNVTYRLTVANAGTVAITGVKLRLKLPNGLVFASCQMDGGKLLEGSACDDAALYEWTVAGPLDAGVSLTVNPTIRVQSGVTAPLVASVRAIADGVDQPTATVTTMVDASPPLQLAMVGGPDPVAAGEELGYTITFGNRSGGTAALPGATLTAAVPPGAVLDPASVGDGGQVAADGSKITWPLGDLNPGAAGQRTFAVTVTGLGAAESWIRQATAELRDATLPQPNSARASAVTVVEAAPALQLVLGTTLDPVQKGSSVTYQLTATNLGAPLTGVKLRLKLPNGLVFASCQMDAGKLLEGSACDDAALYEWTVPGTLATGASVTVLPSVTTETTLSPGSLLATIARVVADGGRSAGATVTTRITQ